MNGPRDKNGFPCIYTIGQSTSAVSYTRLRRGHGANFHGRTLHRTNPPAPMGPRPTTDLPCTIASHAPTSWTTDNTSFAGQTMATAKRYECAWPTLIGSTPLHAGPQGGWRFISPTVPARPVFPRQWTPRQSGRQHSDHQTCWRYCVGQVGTEHCRCSRTRCSPGTSGLGSAGVPTVGRSSARTCRITRIHFAPRMTGLIPAVRG